MVHSEREKLTMIARTGASCQSNTFFYFFLREMLIQDWTWLKIWALPCLKGEIITYFCGKVAESQLVVHPIFF